MDKTTTQVNIPEKYAICISIIEKGSKKGKPPVCPILCNSYKDALKELALYVEKCERAGGEKTKLGRFPYEYFGDNSIMLDYSEKSKVKTPHFELISIVPVFNY